jgi:hypothetical protein
VLLDHYVAQGDTQKAIGAVTAMEKRVGVDGVTSLLKANVYLRAATYEQTVSFAQNAIRIEPDLQDGYYSLAMGYIGQGKFKEALDMHQSISSRFGRRFQRSGFVSDPKFAAFVQSAAFQKWLPAQG